MKSPTKRQNYYLTAGKVVFTQGEEVNAVDINAVVTSDLVVIPVRGIAKAQQALHGQFIARMGDDAAAVVVRDIVITAMIPLGKMTAQEFNAPPEGTELTELTGVSVELKADPVGSA